MYQYWRISSTGAPPHWILRIIIMKSCWRFSCAVVTRICHWGSKHSCAGHHKSYHQQLLLSPITDKSRKSNKFTYMYYAITLSLIWHGFRDSIKHGDGIRIFGYCKVLLVIFKPTDRCNYGKEAVYFIYRHPERQQTQVVKEHEHHRRGQGQHDLHLIRRLKGILRNLGSNINPKSIPNGSICVQGLSGVRVWKSWQTEPHTSSTSIVSYGFKPRVEGVDE